METFKYKNPKLKEETVPDKPKLPEITPNPKERPVTKPEKPDKIPPDLNPDKSKPQEVPVKP